MPDLLNYYDIAEAVVSELETLPADREALQAICLAWQWRKNMFEAKTGRVRKQCEANEEHPNRISNADDAVSVRIIRARIIFCPEDESL
ncbi:hypothetical protein QUF72_10625 [Desulfobacterales bacterium HSG2]|nr:hypothetical protein [Desulfobacterales bacterium HSG2]